MQEAKRQSNLKLCFFTVLLFFINASFLFSQQVKTNLEIFEDIISSKLDMLFFSPTVERDRKFYFKVNAGDESLLSKSETKFIVNIIKKIADAGKLKYAFAINNPPLQDSAYNLVTLDINKFKVSYPRFIKNKFLGDKTIQRVVDVNISIEIRNNIERSVISDSVRTVFKDEIDFETYSSLENSSYLFTKALPPDIGLLERVIFPVAVITVSAAAIVLFFIIRSK